MANIYAMSDTWNDGVTTFTAIKMNVTDTASASGSLLMDLQVGGTSLFRVSKTGLLNVQNALDTGVVISGGSNLFKTIQFGGSILGSNGLAAIKDGGVIVVRGGGGYHWEAGVNEPATGAIDLALKRDAANTLAQRNGTNAQTFNIYNTYDSSTIYERGFMKWNSNVLEIGTEHLNGNARGLNLQTNGQTRLSISAAGVVNVPSTPFVALGSFAVTSGYNSTLWNGGLLGWQSAGSASTTGTPDVCFNRSDAGIVGVRASSSSTGGSLEFIEQTAPAAGSATSARIFAEDDGAGKTRLMVQFGTGVAQQIAIEP